MRFVKRKSTVTKMINNSFADTWGQADRLTTRQGKRDARRKEMQRAKEKKMWVHRVGNWECRRKLRHPKRFFWKESFDTKSKQGSWKLDERSNLDSFSWLGFRARHPHAHITKLLICAYKFPRISQCDFPVMCFFQQVGEGKDDKEFLSWHIGTGRHAYYKAKARATRRKEMERAKKKKRCGFIMFVNESAAAGCGIPNDSFARIRCKVS